MPALTADELYRRGVAHTNAGRIRTARRALTAGLERAQDQDLRARIIGTLAYALSQLGETDDAVRLCREALAGGGTTPRTEAVLCGQLGAIALHRGDTAEAESWLTRGIDGAVDPVQRANMLVNRSVARMQARRLTEATADLEVAAAAYAEHGDPLDVALAEHNAGYVALLVGDLLDALVRMSSARAVAAESPVNAAICDLDRAEVLRDAGLTTEAEALLTSVARTLGAHGMRPQRAQAEYQLARSLLLHDPERAATVAASAARRFAALRSLPWAARAKAIRLRARLAAGQLRRSGEPVRMRTGAERWEVDETVAELDRHGLRDEALALRLTWALSATRRGVPDGRLPRVPASASIPVRLLAHEARAVRALSAGRPARARAEAAAGSDLLTRWQSAFGALDLQSSLAMHGTGIMIAGLTAAVRSKRVDLVFEWAERARQLSQQVIALRPPVDPETAADLAELRMLRAEQPEATGDPRVAALRDRVRDRQWAATAAARTQERVDMVSVQGVLEPGTAALSYVFGGADLTCVAVTDGAARLVSLGDWRSVNRLFTGLRADLDMAASVQVGPLVQVVRGALEARLSRLSALLVEPVLRAIGDADRIVVTAPGVLAGMPWAMLPALRGRALTVAPSLSRWVGDRDRAAQVAAVGFAAGPRVARGDEEIAIAAAAWGDAAALGDTAVARGGARGGAGAARGGAAVLRGERATVDAVTALADEVDVLHIAAHGRHAVDNPLFSGLELSDGTLFGYDIDRVPTPPRTVVLSACEVGRSSVRWGEEALGMTRAWLHAGVRCVVAAPVIVADDVACELLGAMHAGLAVGWDPSVALAEASVRTGLSAPFQCHGSGF